MERTHPSTDVSNIMRIDEAGSRVESMYRLLLLLADSPDQCGFLAGLVHSVLRDDLARAAALATVSPAGYVYVTGSYGLPLDEVSSRLGASVWQDTPLTTVVRSGRPWIGLSDGAHSNRGGGEPECPGRFCLALPIQRWGHPMGALFITADRKPDLATDGAFWLGVAAACTGFVTNARPAIERLGPRTAMLPAPGPRLNDRDLSILRLVAEGRNNGQIGRELGYSLSTIAHALVAIYRELGVSARQDAVEVAVSMGLLDVESAATPPSDDQGLLSPSDDPSLERSGRMSHRLAVGSPPRSREQ